MGESSGLVSKPISVSQTVFITREMCLTPTVVGGAGKHVGPCKAFRWILDAEGDAFLSAE